MKNYKTLKEVSKILKISEKELWEKIRKILPYKMKIGKTVYLNETEVKIISV